MSPCARIKANKDNSLLKQKKNGAKIYGSTRLTYWTVEYLTENNEVIDEISVNTLTEAEEAAYYFYEDIYNTSE